MVEIKKMLVPVYTVGNKLYAKGKHRNAYVGAAGINSMTEIAVHQTGNESAGADAVMHGRLQANGNPRVAGWPFTVDDKVAIQSFNENLRLFNTGSTRGHNNAIGIEICVNKDGNYKKALQNAAELIRHLMKKHNIPITKVHQHNHYSGKNCPSQLRAGKDGITWSKFIDMIKGVHVDVKPAQSAKPTATTSAKLIKNENAYFLVTTPDGIKVRNKPSVSATHTGTLKKGDSINYKRVFEGGGYRWLEYTGNSGNTLFVPYRESGNEKEQWGTFHSERPGKAAPAPKPVPKPVATTYYSKKKDGKKYSAGVLKLQKDLISIHFYPQKNKANRGADGYYGNATEDAVKRFQSVYTPHEVDGVAGPNTLAALAKQVK